MAKTFENTFVEGLSLKDIKSLPEYYPCNSIRDEAFARKEDFLDAEPLSSEQSDVLEIMDILKGNLVIYESISRNRTLGDEERAILAGRMLNNVFEIVNPFDTNQNIVLDKFEKEKAEYHVELLFGYFVLYGVRNYWDMSISSCKVVSLSSKELLFPDINIDLENYIKACEYVMPAIRGFIRTQKQFANLMDTYINMHEYYENRVVYNFYSDIREELSMYFREYLTSLTNFKVLIMDMANVYYEDYVYNPTELKEFELMWGNIEELSSKRYIFSQKTDKIIKSLYFNVV